MSQRNHGPEDNNSAQERNERLNGLRSATDGLQEGGVQKAQQNAEGSQMYRKLNTGSQIGNEQNSVKNMMNNPQGRDAVNQALQQLGAPSFQNRTDWMGSNPALAKQVMEMAKQTALNSMGNGQFNTGGVNINRQQTNAYARGP